MVIETNNFGILISKIFAYFRNCLLWKARGDPLSVFPYSKPRSLLGHV